MVLGQKLVASDKKKSKFPWVLYAKKLRNKPYI